MSLDGYVKFEYDDGADVYYKINPSEETVTFKTVVQEVISKEVTLYYDEVEKVYDEIQKLKFK